MSIIEVNLEHLNDVENRLGAFKKKTPNVLSKAINRAAENAKTNMAKLTVQKYIIKNKDVKETIKVIKSNKSNLNALVKSEGKLLGLDKFKINPKSRPQRPPRSQKAQVKKSGSLKSILRAFIITVNGKSIVMQREGVKRLPIKRLFGPAVPEMIGNEETFRELQQKANETLQKRIDHEINRILEAR